MIDQPAGAVDVQHQAGAAASITMTAEPFGPVPDAPMVEWSKLAEGTYSQHLEMYDVLAACSLSDGSMILLRKGATGGIEIGGIGYPWNPAPWYTPAWDPGPIATGTVTRAAAFRQGTTVRAAWVESGNVYVCDGLDDGTDWQAVTTIYAGGDADDRHIGLYLMADYWLLGWSTTEPRPYVAWQAVAGGAWNQYSYYKNHRFAGAMLGEPYANISTGSTEQFLNLITFVDNSLPNVATSFVRVIRLDFSATPTIDGYHDAETLMTGDQGLNFYDLFYRQLYDGSLLGVALLGGLGGGYICALSSAYNLVEADYHYPTAALHDVWVDEPIPAQWLYASLSTDAVPITIGELAAAEGRLYYIQNYKPAGGPYGSAVYIGEPVTVPPSGYEVTAYRYDWRRGRATIELSGDSTAPVVGSLITLTRILSWRGRQAQASAKLLALSLERTRGGMRLLAVDALGWLSHYRARQTVRIADGSIDFREALPRLLARCGLVAQISQSAGDATAFAVTHKSGESGIGALQRLASTGFVFALPIAGRFGLRFMIGEEATEGNYRYGPGAIPIAEVTAITDGRRFAAAHILGQRSTDPADGSFLGVSAGPVLPGVRPLPVSYTNTRYNSPSLVTGAANAEAKRQQSLAIDAVVETSPNMALELYDQVRVTWLPFEWMDRTFQVHGVIEHFDHGRLRHELRLGTVA